MRWAKRFFYFSLIALVLAGVTVRLLRGDGRVHEMRKVQTWSPAMVPEAHAAGPGVLAISARATMVSPWYDTLVWYTVDVRRIADDGEETSVYTRDCGNEPSMWTEGPGATTS
jgi:hypothetical protein